MAASVCVQHLIGIMMYSKKARYDQFYTTPAVAAQCLSILDLTQYDCVIEPSAGAGAFFSQIVHPQTIGMDIAPAAPGIQSASWFDYRIPSQFRDVLVVGNPPFGVRNRLSLAFIHHALQFDNVRTVAFILPNAYHKHTLQKRIAPRYRLAQILPLPADAFTFNGMPFHLPCAFFVFDQTPGNGFAVSSRSVSADTRVGFWHERCV